MNSHADAYHDEHGRPLAETSSMTLTASRDPKLITRGGMPYEPPRPITPIPVATPAADSPDLAAEKRSARSRKAAETVRKKKHNAAVEQEVQKSLSRITARIVNEQHRAEEQARKDALDPPGTPTARGLIALAREHGIERELYRVAQQIRAPWSAAQWTAPVRSELGTALASIIAKQKPKPTKGQPK